MARLVTAADGRWLAGPCLYLVACSAEAPASPAPAGESPLPNAGGSAGGVALESAGSSAGGDEASESVAGAAMSAAGRESEGVPGIPGIATCDSSVMLVSYKATRIAMAEDNASCLEVSDAGVSESACNDVDTRRLSLLLRQDDCTAQIANAQNQCLSVDAGGALTLAACDSSNDAQRWDIVDNGDESFAKGSFYEGGIRVPAIFTWPARYPGGQVRNQVVWSLDLMPTLAELLEFDLPTDRVLDGKSIVSVLESADAPTPHDALHWYFSSNWASREGHLKHVKEGDGAPALYDLSTDIGETNNLAASRSEDVARLQAAFDEWQADIE